MKRRLDKHKDGEDADIDTSRYKSYTRRHEGIRHIQLSTLGDFVPATVPVTRYQKLELLYIIFPLPIHSAYESEIR